VTVLAVACQNAAVAEARVVGAAVGRAVVGDGPVEAVGAGEVADDGEAADEAPASNDGAGVGWLTQPTRVAANSSAAAGFLDMSCPLSGWIPFLGFHSPGRRPDSPMRAVRSLSPCRHRQTSSAR
jgi:hypothetical protein